MKSILELCKVLCKMEQLFQSIVEIFQYDLCVYNSIIMPNLNGHKQQKHL